MLGMHRYLSALSLVFIGVHLVALLADSYIAFAVIDVLVPFHSPWRNTAVGIGVIAMWTAVAVELTSLVQRRLPRAVWRRIHLASYGVFALASIHSLSAGTDVREVVAGGVAVGLGGAAVLIGTVLWVARSTARAGRVTAWESTSVP
jgi:predicted ferric reductase